MVERKRGLIRLGIVFALGWCLFWGAAAYFGNQTNRIYIEQIASVRRQAQEGGQPIDRAFLESLSPLWAEANEANDWVQASVVWGLGIPLLLLIVVPIGWWVYRGFKPKAKT